MRIGFVGLGEQGEPIARRVAELVGELRVYARTPSQTKWFRDHGVPVADSIEALAADLDVLQVCVRDDNGVRQVVHDALPFLREGATIVVHSTISPKTCRELASIASERGVGVVDAPVSGGPARALVGDLTLFVGGADRDVAPLEPIFDAAASHVFRTGPVGSGMSLKLLNNLMLAVNLAHVAQIRQVLPNVELDDKAAFQALSTSSGSSHMMQVFVAWGGKDLFYTHEKGYDYGVEVVVKDVELAIAMLQESCPGDQFPTELVEAARAGVAAIRR